MRLQRLLVALTAASVATAGFFLRQTLELRDRLARAEIRIEELAKSRDAMVRKMGLEWVERR